MEVNESTYRKVRDAKNCKTPPQNPSQYIRDEDGDENVDLTKSPVSFGSLLKSFLKSLENTQQLPLQQMNISYRHYLTQFGY